MGKENSETTKDKRGNEEGPEIHIQKELASIYREKGREEKEEKKKCRHREALYSPDNRILWDVIGMS